MKITKDVSREFTSTMEVKQGCPLSFTLFGLFIDQLEEFIQGAIEEHEEKTAIGRFIVLILIHVTVLSFCHILS